MEVKTSQFSATDIWGKKYEKIWNAHFRIHIYGISVVAAAITAFLLNKINLFYVLGFKICFEKINLAAQSLIFFEKYFF